MKDGAHNFTAQAQVEIFKLLVLSKAQNYKKLYKIEKRSSHMRSWNH